MASLIGRKLGKYDIVALVGQGGMATVYKGYRNDIDRYVAVKVLPPHPGLDQQFIERFRLEARTIARLQHPHILPLYDYGVEDDILYLITAYVDGGSLNDRIDKGDLPPAQVANLLRQVASALDYAHRQGVIHRDIKPDNILLDNEGHALLADFGIVKLAEGEARLTVTGGLVGTPAYMSPEQGRGETVTNSADIYSLGVVVYEMLTGKQPFTAPTPMQVVLKHMTEPVPHLSAEAINVPPALDMVMQRALAKNPAERYRTAMDFAEDFTRATQQVQGTNPMLVLENRPAADAPTSINAPTPFPGGYPTVTPGTGGHATPTPSTIIVQEKGMNPLLLLGGFGLIALILVVAVFVLVNNSRPIGPPPATAASTQTALEVTPTSGASVIAANPTAVPSFGRVSYTTTNAPGDTVILTSLQNLKPPPAGRVYAAWLLNTTTDDKIVLGELAVDALGRGTLAPYIDPDGRPLFTLYNAIAITDEPRMAETPTGPVVYSAMVPAEVMTALTQILISSPASASADTVESLLVVAEAEAATAAQHAGMAATSTNLGAVQTHAEHVTNILAGTQQDYNGNGRGENPGRSIGVVPMLDAIEAQLDVVAQAPGASSDLQSELELIRVCTQNARQRASEVTELAQKFLASADLAALTDDLTQAQTTAEALLHGIDLNNNGQVDPFEGECGLDQISTFGVLVSSMNLTEGSLPE